MPKIVCKKIEKTSYEKPKETETKLPSLAANILSINIDVYEDPAKSMDDFDSPMRKVFTVASYEKSDTINILYYIKSRYKGHQFSLYISRQIIQIYRTPTLVINDENIDLMIQTMRTMPIDELKIIESKRLVIPIFGGENNE